MITDAAFWNRGIDAVPVTTGAAAVMDCADLLDVCKHLGVAVPMPAVLDVGCGTGRWAQFCDDYLGVDVSSDAIAFAERAGLNVTRIDGPWQLPDLSVLRERAMETGDRSGHSRAPFAPADWITCFSVFTHIDRAERYAYLQRFRHLAPNAIVDIIPGDGTGDVALWTADPREFTADASVSGWDIRRIYERTAPDGVSHRYYRLEAV